MNRKSSITARILAALALVASVVVVIAVVSAATGGNGDTGRPKATKTKQNQNQNGGNKKPATDKKVYVVKEGDTLTVIAVDTGVSIEQIEKLNPALDPQALIPGQKLKLR